MDARNLDHRTLLGQHRRRLRKRILIYIENACDVAGKVSQRMCLAFLVCGASPAGTIILIIPEYFGSICSIEPVQKTRQLIF